MPHTVTVLPPPLARKRQVVPAFVFKVLPTEKWPDVTAPVPPDEAPQVRYLPNVKVQDISRRAGPIPGSATIYYEFNKVLGPKFGWPTRVEHVMGFNATGLYVLNPDDRVIIAVPDGRGNLVALMDGYCQVPQADLNERSEMVSIRVVDRTFRAWDKPVGGMWIRDSNMPPPPDPENPLPDDQDPNLFVHQTTWPVHFNPGDEANMDPDKIVVDDVEEESPPLFHKPGLLIVQYCRVFYRRQLMDQAPLPAKWNLPEAVRYLLVTCNTNQDHIIHEHLLKYIMHILVRRYPTKPDVPINLDDPQTYTEVPLPCPDVELTGDSWPQAVERLIAPHGFQLTFRLEIIADTGAVVYKAYIKDLKNPDATRQFWFNRAGLPLLPEQNNVQDVKIARDSAKIVNVFVGDTQQIEVEASYICYPLWNIRKPPTANPDIEHMDLFKKSSKDFYKNSFDETFGTPPVPMMASYNCVKYRRFGACEDGGRYYDPYRQEGDPGDIDMQEALPEHFDFGKVFDLEDWKLGDQTRKFVFMKRKVLPRLFRAIQDTDGNPDIDYRPPELWVSTDYPWVGATPEPEQFGGLYRPGPWNPKKDQHWVKITRGGWKLLDEGIGFEVTCEDPNAWEAFEKGAASASGWADAPACLNSGKLRLVNSFAKPDESNPVLIFRLTCVVRIDRNILSVKAARTAGSPTRFEVERREDLRDKYFRRYVSMFSHLTADLTKDTIFQDDEKRAKAIVDARRDAAEACRFAGTAGIGRIQRAFDLGDQVSHVLGRGIDLNSRAGLALGELPRYPTIVAVDLKFGEANGTVYQLEDLRADGIGGFKEK